MKSAGKPGVLDEIDPFKHVLVTGGTGCGKTLSVVLPMLEQCVKFEKDGRKSAVFVCDVKGDLSEPLMAMAKKCGREKDVVEISPDSDQTVDILEWIKQDTFSGASMIYRAVMADCASDKATNDAYWEMGTVEYLASAFAWLSLLGWPVSPDFLRPVLEFTEKRAIGIYGGDSGMRRLDVQDMKRLVAEIRASGNPTRMQLANQLEGILSLAALAESEKTHATFQSMFGQILGRLGHPLIDTLCSPRPTCPVDSWLAEGKIMVVRLPFDQQPLQSNFFARLLKMALFKQVLSPSAERAPRASFFVIDEAHRFITGDEESGDHNFIDRCRAFNCGCIYATQSLNPIKATMSGSRFDSFMANINTRLFGRTLDHPTSAVAADLMGDLDLIRDYQGVQQRIVPDPDPDEVPQPVFEGRGTSLMRLALVDLARLRAGEFYIASGAERFFSQLPAWWGKKALVPRALDNDLSFASAIHQIREEGVMASFIKKLPPWRKQGKEKPKA